VYLTLYAMTRVPREERDGDTGPGVRERGDEMTG
jgi:hypothetical protein